MSRASALALATTTTVAPPVLKAAPAPEPGTPTAAAPQAAAATEVPAALVATDAAPAAATTTEPPKGDQLSIFVKKEAEIFKKNEAIKAREAALIEKERKYDEYVKRVDEFDKTAKISKIDALKMLGWSDTDFINELNREKPTIDPIKEVEKVVDTKIDQYKKEQAEEQAKATTKAQEALVTNFKTEIGDKLKSKASEYKFAAHKGKEAEVQAYHIIAKNLETNNEMMSIEEALQITNDLYKDEYDSARKLFEEQKAAVEEVVAPATDPTQGIRGSLSGKPPVSNTPQAPRPRTLSNNVSATAASAPVTVSETREQKRQRLIESIQKNGLRK